MLITRYLDEANPVVSGHWFSPIRKEYSPREVDAFLAALAVPFTDLPMELRKHDQANRRSFEFYEQTPFLRFPLVRRSENYWCIYPNVLYSTLEHFIYDRLRGWDA
jgi:hypothetical protein